MRKNKLDKMANFMEIKSIKPKLKQSEMVKDLQISTFALKRYRRKKICFHLIQNHYHQTLTQQNKETSNNTEHDLKINSIHSK